MSINYTKQVNIEQYSDYFEICNSSKAKAILMYICTQGKATIDGLSGTLNFKKMDVISVVECLVSKNVLRRVDGHIELSESLN